ncbi:uncharacterized protein MELLADRAFT_87328 [Melampsora larici-populina 98AG31]|uniref:Uncharacterized protein n=1 Tax=Melampsora larici-populina (strain 98AG31 / pathotype 3-4-7) TaxID=747676 RepID=F4RMV1_MELLP|nr:uncharacterized protein MELLADRAFT_87328 [Melampsora larici-populina 98AG31]EGG06176.1 hypothetical protein MELLADRAFT_87328 [Melampsora larici-populina 98AG31]
MDNPKVQARTDSKELKFNCAMQHNIPDALNDDKRAAVEIIKVDAKVQAQRVMLMTMYGTTSIGGRECMGMINTKDSSLEMHLSHLAFDIWAKAIKGVPVATHQQCPLQQSELEH